MSDDTRDIAIRADEAGKSAHKRLDTINGQIRRLGDETAGLRLDQEKATSAILEHLADGISAVRDDLQTALYDKDAGLVPQVVALRTSHQIAMRVAGAVTAIAISVTSGVVVYTLTHNASSHQSHPIEQIQRQATAK